ncbi:helix-turn-helix domain-containing protein [Streptococcus uberis]|uniref:helix-turn-helix domain-containing protein n=1 Tax=Streptococcus uberis TaxID=1349 RepID=UPI00215056C8|nr:helix-turn-helix transcriptional regulator [Streptococcus uberis]MCR4253705.1 helix-turn-helix domain-containing protein [Streptococcus uberis]MCR4255698.1 helix-turn-helix domain-containing protein [Streptococcus uberis]MCR4260155.1 helix-turn-helix domain-containing protein [Streptococcus uberis]MCR4262364.1 helix-turn-helix domain-containing protein [Streptococcus uberis]
MENNISILIGISGKTIKEISNETGISYTTLASYNQGARNPKKNNAITLANYFGVSVPFLLGQTDEPNLYDPSKRTLLTAVIQNVKGQKLNDRITEWTPYKNDISFIQKISETSKFNKALDELFEGSEDIALQATKQAIKEAIENLPYVFNFSSSEKSNYHYIWENWIETEEYKQKFNIKK